MALFNNLPVVTHTLREFADRAFNLHENDETDDNFIRFVLTGEYTDNQGGSKQAFIDPIQNFIEPDHSLLISRDYDSLLGIADKVMVDCPISVYVVPHDTFSLRTSIHLKHPIYHEGEVEQVDYHKIPNFEFGSFGMRHHLHIFFPRLWSPERSQRGNPTHLNEHERTFWYENGFRPAIAALLGQNIASEWPAKYSTEQFRAKKSRGGFSWGTKLIPSNVVPHLASRIRTELGENPLVADDDITWARDFFFLHTIRGTKHSTFHRADAYSAEYYLNDFISSARLSEEVPDYGDWYIDVGIEISSEQDECLQWTTSAHYEVVQQALQISSRNAERISDINSSKYTRDLVSHLTAISGFRAVPGVRAQGRYEAAYIQAYTTDKSIVYHPEGRHHAKFITVKEAMGVDHPTKTIEGIYNIYEEARTANSSNARLEVRVPYRFATQALIEFNPNALKDCLCSFTRQEWWSFRMTRLLAVSKTLAQQANGATHGRLVPEALALTAACVWLLNSLHARPEDGPAARRLMDAALPLSEAEGLNTDVLAYNTSRRADWQEEEEEGEEGDRRPRTRVPYIPYGCVFFRRIMIGENVPRLRIGGTILTEPAFKFWFEGMTLDQVQAMYQKSGIIPRTALAGKRPTNKARMPTYINVTGVPEPTLFDLQSQGHTLPPPAGDDGSDVDDRSSPADEEPSTIDTFLSQLWRQFVIDLTGKAPNPRGITNPSYLKLTAIQRQEGKEDIYKNLTLSDVFTDVAYKKASTADWQRVFKWLFPEPGYKTTNAVQNYPSSPYFKTWMEFIDDPKNSELVAASRSEIWKRVRNWSWVPDAQQDKMWPTKAASGFTRWPNSSGSGGKDRAAPRILLKSNAVPVFSTVADTHLDEGED